MTYQPQKIFNKINNILAILLSLKKTISQSIFSHYLHIMSKMYAGAFFIL